MKKKTSAFKRRNTHFFPFDLCCYLHNILKDLFLGDPFQTKRFSRCSRAVELLHFTFFSILVPLKRTGCHNRTFQVTSYFLDCNNLVKSFWKEKYLKIYGKYFKNPKQFKNTQYFSIYYFFPTCLTNTFFITTIGESAGKELLVVTGHCQGPSSAFQHNAFSTSSESVCSIALRHSELPSARCRIQLLVVLHAACLLPPFSSTILLPFNQATKNNKV